MAHEAAAPHRLTSIQSGGGCCGGGTQVVKTLVLSGISNPNSSPADTRGRTRKYDPPGMICAGWLLRLWHARSEVAIRQRHPPRLRGRPDLAVPAAAQAEGYCRRCGLFLHLRAHVGCGHKTPTVGCTVRHSLCPTGGHFTAALRVHSTPEHLGNAITGVAGIISRLQLIV